MIQINISYAQYQSSWEGRTIDFKGHGFKWNPGSKAWEGTMEQAQALLEEIELDIEQIRSWCAGRSSVRARKGREVAGTFVEVARIVRAVITENTPEPAPAKRSWSRSEKRDIVAKYRAAARGTKKAVLEAHGIARSYIYRWEKSEASAKAVEKIRAIFDAAQKEKEAREAAAQEEAQELAFMRRMKAAGFPLTDAAKARLAAAEAA